MKKKRLNQAGLDAVAEGLSEADALKNPNLVEEVEEENPEGKDKGKTPEASAKAEGSEGEDKSKKPETPDPAVSAENKPNQAQVSGDLLDRVIKLSAELATAQAKINELNSTVALMKTEEQGMREIVVKSINRMLPALGHSKMSEGDKVSSSYLISKWSEVNTEFYNRFPGSPRAVAASDSDQVTGGQENNESAVPLSTVSVGGKSKKR